MIINYNNVITQKKEKGKRKNDEIINNIFGSFTACNIYKYSGSGYILKRNTKEAVYGYFLNYANLEILNKSFFDEIRSKKAPLIAGNPRL